MSSTDVVVIGAGPNGLSLGAHLDPKGVERRVFGHRMGSWRHNMPDGMILKSEPYASDLSAPFPGFSAGDFCRSVGLDYRDRVTPISRERFIEYGEWFADKLVSDIEETEITSLAKHGRGFHLSTAAGEQISARRVVVASGIIPFGMCPESSRTCRRIWCRTARPILISAVSGGATSPSSVAASRRSRRPPSSTSLGPARDLLSAAATLDGHRRTRRHPAGCAGCASRSPGCARAGPAGPTPSSQMPSDPSGSKPGSRGLGRFSDRPAPGGFDPASRVRFRCS